MSGQYNELILTASASLDAASCGAAGYTSAIVPSQRLHFARSFALTPAPSCGGSRGNASRICSKHVSMCDRSSLLASSSRRTRKLPDIKSCAALISCSVWQQVVSLSKESGLLEVGQREAAVAARFLGEMYGHAVRVSQSRRQRVVALGRLDGLCLREMLDEAA